MTEFNKVASQSEGYQLRVKGDECMRIADLHFRDGDMEGWQAWYAKAKAWYKLANRLNHVYPDLEPPKPEES